MKSLAMVLAATALTVTASAATPPTSFEPRGASAAGEGLPADSILGEWWTEDRDARIRFVKQEDGTYRGLVTWSLRPRKDRFNKDPKLRERPILGTVLMWHLVYGNAKYEDGYIYNPLDGDTYRVKAWLTHQNSLKLRGYLGISLLGQTQTWTRRS